MAVAPTLALMLTIMAPPGCAPHAAPTQPSLATAPRPPADRQVAALTDLLTHVRLEWLVLAHPEQLAALPWLKAPLGLILRDERLDLLARATGIDLRAVPQLALASYRAPERTSSDHTVAFFVRHRTSPIELERKFRTRLTSAAERNTVGHQLVTVWGNIGLSPHGMVVVGTDVVGYQYGGSKGRGPIHIAALYADGMLASIPTALEDETMGALGARLQTAMLAAYLPGPFEGPMARGARGLLGASSALGVTIEPTGRQTLRLRLVVLGRFTQRTEDALHFLQLAWEDLAKSDLGGLLDLDHPTAPPIPSATPLGLELTTELDADALLRGLAAATSADVVEIMRQPDREAPGKP